MPHLTPDVFEGLDGYLFLTGGSNNVGSQFAMEEKALNEKAEDWKRLISERGSWLRGEGIDYLHFFAPDKLSVLPEKAPGILERIVSFAQYFEERLGSDDLSRYVISATCILKSGSAFNQVYGRTDSHWTSLGCKLVYQAICASAGLCDRSDLIDKSLEWMSYSGDLGEKLSSPRIEEFLRSRMPLNASRVWANDLVLYNEKVTDSPVHVGCMVEYRNRFARSDKSILLFGDSFCEYRPGFLTGMLADTVSRLVFVWSSSLDRDLILEVKPDLVITEIAERYTRQLPRDNVDIRSYAALRLQQISAPRN